MSCQLADCCKLNVLVIAHKWVGKALAYLLFAVSADQAHLLNGLWWSDESHLKLCPRFLQSIRMAWMPTDKCYGREYPLPDKHAANLHPGVGKVHFPSPGQQPVEQTREPASPTFS